MQARPDVGGGRGWNAIVGIKTYCVNSGRMAMMFHVMETDDLFQDLVTEAKDNIIDSALNKYVVQILEKEKEAKKELKTFCHEDKDLWGVKISKYCETMS